MKYILLLSQENSELPAYEAESLLELKNPKQKKHLLHASIDKKNLLKIKHLAYTKKIFELLFESRLSELEKNVACFDWSKIYKDSFCLRIHLMDIVKKNYDEGEYAKYVWRSLVGNNINPRVDLDNPMTLIEIFIFKDIAYICKLIHENAEHYEDRKAHMKPALHPTAMHPKMAKGLVNILNPKKPKPLIDPFCGAGGILLEAALMDIRSIGYDIDNPMLNRARINMQHYKINPKLYKLVNKNCLSSKKMENIVTDLPYGKSSKKSSEIINLYSMFIKKISGRAVIVFPDFVDYKKILKTNLSKKLKIKKIISYYVHKTLTRKIVVIG